METPVVKNMFTPSEVCKSPKGKEPAQQQFKDDADINSIMKKFQKTGTLEHVKLYESEYGFATPTDYHHSMNVILKADAMFSELPSSIRNKFSNNPKAFLEFVQNEENREEAQKLGLVIAPKGEAKPLPEPSGTAKPDEAPASGEGPPPPATTTQAPPSEPSSS